MNFTMLKSLVAGGLTFVPGLNRILSARWNRPRERDSARYCYTVWMRHLVLSGGVSTPETVVELGPGGALGCGLAALLSGAERYRAVDVMKLASAEKDVPILEEIAHLFRSKSPIPDDSEFPEVKPKLESYEFPGRLITDEILKKSLDEKRLRTIRGELANFDNDKNAFIKYFAPWDNASVIENGSADMIFSQAVLEHVEDLEAMYKTLNKWLKPGGIMSHQVDFSSHGLHPEWNGLWAYSDFAWRLIKRKKYYPFNREPVSMHENLLEKNSFRIIRIGKTREKNTIEKSRLAPGFKSLSEDDLTTRSAFVQATKIL